MMRKTLGVSLLILLLTVPASAGIMPNDTPAPPPQPASAAQGSARDGIMPNDSEDNLTQTVLDLLAALPSLF